MGREETTIDGMSWGEQASRFKRYFARSNHRFMKLLQSHSPRGNQDSSGGGYARI